MSMTTNKSKIKTCKKSGFFVASILASVMALAACSSSSTAESPTEALRTKEQAIAYASLK